MKLISDFQGVSFGLGPHLVLGKTIDAAHKFLLSLQEKLVSEYNFWDRVHFHFGEGKHWSETQAIHDSWSYDDQHWISTQDFCAINCIGFGTVQDIHERILLVKDGKVQNLPIEDAEDFKSAYDVGIMHVSEILRTKGLW